MVSSLDFFTDFINIPKGESRKVQLPTGETSRIMHLGSSNILNGVQIKNVIYVPQFRYNLLSVSQLTRDIGCFIAFFPAWCVFQDICNGKVKGIGKLEKGLYVLDLKHKSNLKLPIGVITSALVMNRISSYLWHKILGHIPLDALKRLPVFHNKTFIDCNEHCPVCPLAKKTRLPFPISSSRCDIFGDLIHANIWGPFKVPTFDGKRYFLTIVYDFSRVPSRILSGKLPFELVFHKNFTLDHLRIFGCLAYAANLKRQHKFSPRAVPAIFLAPVYDSDFDDLVLPLPHHSTTSQDTPSSDLEHLDDSVVVTPPHIPLTEDLQGSSTSHTTMLPFPDDLPSSPTNHITPIPFTYALLSYVDDDLTVDGIRKSTRPSRPPIWTNDYVVRQTAGKSKPCNYPIANSISYQALKHAYSQCLATYSAEIEPIRTIIALAAHHGWLIYQIDVHNAFLQGDLLEEVYMTIPPGFSPTTARQSRFTEILQNEDLGELKFFLGIEFARSSKGTYMSQRKYALELIAELGLAGSKPASTPLEVNQKLTTFMYALKQSHLDAATRVVRYIKAALGQGLLLPVERDGQLLAYCDADWGACLHTRRSVTGYLVFYGDALIFWKLKKQETVARNSTEVEFQSMALEAAEIV
nr:uncharacterized protein LOC104111161 [Nicotiana tomentosiformis]